MLVRTKGGTFQPPLQLLTLDWHMGRIRKHKPNDVTTD